MPIFEYACVKCGKVSEFILMTADPRPTKCPTCGGKLHKCLSAPAIQFKGSGWYVTDYAKRPSPETPGKQESQKSKDGKESKDTKESKETKPAEGAATAASDTPSKDSSPGASKKES